MQTLNNYKKFLNPVGFILQLFICYGTLLNKYLFIKKKKSESDFVKLDAAYSVLPC